MSCASRSSRRQRDYEYVKLMAQRTANLTNIPQKLYKTICDGVQIYKFSPTWKGQVIEEIKPAGVHHTRKLTSESVLRDSKDTKLKSTKSKKSKSKSKRSAGNMGEDIE